MRAALLLLAGMTTVAAAEPHAGPRYVGRVLVDGATTHEAAGLAFDSHDRLYNVSLLGHSLRTFDTTSGALTWERGFAQGVVTPDDLVIAPDGTIYYTSFFTGQVVRVSPDGTLAPIALIGPGIDGIALSPGGRLVASQFLAGDGIYELDPTGVAAPRLITHLPGMEAITFGPGGVIYAALIFQGEIARIDIDTGAVTTVASGLTTPISVKINHAGQMFSVENLTGRILKVNPTTGAVSVVAVSNPGLDNIAFDSHDRMFVSSVGDGSIIRVSAGGSIKTIRRGGMVAAGGLAVARQDGAFRLFEADAVGLRTFDVLLGRELDMVPQVFGDPAGALALPLTVAPYGDRLAITSWIGSTVQIWNQDTATVDEFFPDFIAPTNAIEFRGELVVAELGTGSVVRRDAATGAHETLASGLFVPTGLAARGGSLWVTDWATGVLWKIAANGAPLPAPVAVRAGLQGPEGLAVDLAGRLIVSEVGAHRVLAIDPDTGVEDVVVDGLPGDIPPSPGAVPTWVFSGVAVGPLGTIYVSVAGSSQILQLHRR